MIQAITYIDIWALSVAVWKAKRAFSQTDGLLDLKPVLEDKDWLPAKNALMRCQLALAPQATELPEVAEIYIERLMPQEAKAWTKGPTLFHLPIVTNPLAFVYAGAFSGTMPAGQLTGVDGRALCSAVNHGNHPRYHLVFSLVPAAVPGVIPQ